MQNGSAASNGKGPDEESMALAIIGLATRFPGEAATTDGLWHCLEQGRCLSTPFPDDRLGRGHYHPDPEHGGTHAVQGGHFLSEDPAYFDAPFFSITKGEAQIMDPQQRLVLENVYHAFENAGLPMSRVASSNTAVFVSGFNHDHLQNVNADSETTLRYKSTGLTNSMLSNRISWFFDLKGVSATLDSACSSSMVALHLGCQSLQTHEAEMAVVSGVTVIAYPGDITGMSYQGFLGQQGRCFSFDHRADGYARGEGVGTLIVKRLADAVRDGDTIRAVIRGTGVNQDGRTPGLTLPDSAAQERLIKSVYAAARLSVDETSMIEAHGTGTVAGDPIEANAIARAFASRRSPTPLYVGAIKSNTGHLEGAAGVAGVIKAVLVLEQGIIPPNANFEKVNPKIPAKRWKLQFPVECTPWPSTGLRRISVNSFGVGGTNGHAILDDAYHYLRDRGLCAPHHTRPSPPTRVYSEDRSTMVNGTASNLNGHMPNGTHQQSGDAMSHLVNDHSKISFASANYAYSPVIIPLSSFDAAGLQRLAEMQVEYLRKLKIEADEDESLLVRDYAYTMSRRSKLGWRGFVLANSIPSLIENLSRVPQAIRAREGVRVGFVFTGQGAQWPGMAKELLHFPIFRGSMDEATTYFQSLGASWSLLEELSRDETSTNVHQAYLAQPACTAIQIALLELLRSWGVIPSRVVGHSSGEIAAAFSAGLLSREAAWKVAYFRGLVSNKPSEYKGAMLAVGLSAADVHPYLDQIHAEAPGGALVVACFNSPRNCTVSGDQQRVQLLRAALEQDGVFARQLAVGKAYHSYHMREVADEYAALLGVLQPHPEPSQPRPAMFSTVTKGLAEGVILDAKYWVDNLLSPVLFADGLTAMCFQRMEGGQRSLQVDGNAEDVFVDILIEIGPHGALQSAIKETLAATPIGSAITTLSVLNRRNPGSDLLLSTVAQLSVRGFHVDIDAVNSSGLVPGSRSQLLVDLPGYAFDHTQKHWYESRLSKAHRLRRHERHDLFGAPVNDWNANMPRWRHFLRTAEQPWLRDHVVTGAIVYPGVGYLIAAVEAAKQLADQSLQITGFRLRDCHLKRAMIIPDTRDGLEVSVSMVRMDESSTDASRLWHKFSISSFSAVGDDWIEHCTGYITTDYKSATGPVDAGREAREADLAWREEHAGSIAACGVPLDINRVYQDLMTTGLSFGPLFRNVSAARVSANHTGEVIGTVTVPRIADAMPKGYLSPHTVHPVTMDSMMHFALAGIMNAEGATSLAAPMVPTFINDVWISSECDNQPGQQYHAYGKAKLVAYDKYESEVRVWDAETRTARILIKGIRTSPLDSGQGSEQTGRQLCREITWTPYLGMTTTSALEKSVVGALSDAPSDEMAWYKRLQLATVLLVTDALRVLEYTPPKHIEGHLVKYFEWMQHVQQSILADEVSLVSKADWEQIKDDDVRKVELYAQVENYNANGKLAVRMGHNIIGIIRGEADAMQLMFGQDDLLDHVYGQVAHLGALPTLQKAFLDIVAADDTNLHVLEVGAGTGSSTHHLLESLAPITSPDAHRVWSVAKYTFTDISAAFFEKAAEKFQAHQDILEYRTFNAEKEPAAQGFELGTYDLVVAQNVIHATSDLRKTLANIRPLLKPGGRLLLQEGIRQDYWWSGIAFGLLPGWWLGVESIRKWSPWVASSQWHAILQDAGFVGAELELKDSQDPELHTQSLFVARTVPDGPLGTKRAWTNVVLVTVEASHAFAAHFARSLQAALATEDIHVRKLEELASADLTQSLCISLVDLEAPALMHTSEQEYRDICKMLTVCKGLLWVHGDMTSEPGFGMILGLIRSNRWERDLDDANLVTLSVSEPRHTSLQEQIVPFIVEQFGGDLPISKHNGEYILCGDTISISRLIRAVAADEFLTAQSSKPAPVPTALEDAGRPLKLASAHPGILDQLEWVTDSMYSIPLAETEVEIEIKAVGLNFRDLMIAMGEHMAYSMGCEAAGVISRVGSKVSDVVVGDRVVYICGLANVGCFHTYGRVDQSTVVKIPDALGFEIAAGLPVVYATVIYGLRDAGRLLPNEKILIHAAAGGIGQAAIRYAKHVGAEIFATVSSIEKRDLLINTFGIPEDHIFSSRDLSFVQGITRLTRGVGVDVVLNSLSGEPLRRTWDLIAPFGRFVEIGKKDAQANGRLELRPFLQNVTMTSVDLVTMMKHRPALIRMLTEDTIRLWGEGVAQAATPTTVMGMDRVQEGLQILQSGKGVGKMVFVPHPHDVVPVIPAARKPFMLMETATYVLAGGTGGLGRSIARWMVTRGARQLVFLSSSGAITPAVAQMRDDLTAIGCGVHIFKCDVSDRGQLKSVLEECRATLPPIRGVIQGAMKLEDCMFENMSWETFELAVKPKVYGSWNLHELLPRDMDHFIMLSSATGVLGNRGQANYAAGNTYQDHLSYHRRSQGLPAATVDLGTILSVGYVAENLDRVRMTKHLNTVLETIREDEVHALMEYLLDPRCTAPAQLVTGLTPLERYRSRGVPPPSYLSYPLFSQMRSLNRDNSKEKSQNDGPNVEALLAAATSLDEATTVVSTAVVAKLASLLSVPAEEIQTGRSVGANGVDSLVSMEFRAFLARTLKADVPMLEIMDASSINSLCRRIAALSTAVQISELNSST